MIKFVAIATLALLAVPAVASESAEQRLDRCLVTGASTAPRSSLAVAISEVRSFCGAQLRQVRAKRVAQARRGLAGAAADAAEQHAVLRLNNDVAATIARLTGLNP